jgi:sugar/nucleoside kinase (ribokinase family)
VRTVHACTGSGPPCFHRNLWSRLPLCTHDNLLFALRASCPPALPCHRLLDRGVRCVLVTLGADGCIVCTSNEGATHVPATPLPNEAVVDTTGAGDAFTGAFAVFSGMGLPIPEAARRAGQVASLTVQVAGTQPSYPSRSHVIESLPS